jgi:hypothetical protein
LCFLVFRIPENGKCLEISNPECHAPPSEPFGFFAKVPVAFALSLNIYFSLSVILSEGFCEQGAEENIWTKERWSDGRVEKTA